MKLSDVNIKVLSTILPDFKEGDNEFFQPYALIQELFKRDCPDKVKALGEANAVAEIIIKKFLIEGDFIKSNGLGGSYVLTDKGIELKAKGYNGYFAIEDEKTAKELHDKDVASNLVASTLKKTRQDIIYGKWFLALSVITLLFSVFVWFNGKQNEQKQEMQIETLRSQLQATRHEIYKHLDSLWKINRNADSSEKK